MPENSQAPPGLRLATREVPQRGDSPVSTFAGRMEQSCVVALGKAWVLDSRVELDSLRGGRIQLARRWGRKFTHILCTESRRIIKPTTAREKRRK